MDQPYLEEAVPNPFYLVKSISEQGYSLETSLADLIDNSLAANADSVDIIVDSASEPFTLYLADNGSGMNESVLRASMQFPSASPDFNRNEFDLGRFGLGLKTASFSQTRCFTVLSRPEASSTFSARTWDVDLLREGKWQMVVNSQKEIDEILGEYHELSSRYLNAFSSFEVKTLVVWKGLYKFENYLQESNRKSALLRELTGVTSEYLSMVFHRFMERSDSPLKIRINNEQLQPFNPIPIGARGVRMVEKKSRSFGTDVIKIEGLVLPSTSIDEAESNPNPWTTRNLSLTDMEGLYVYRQNRLITFGGWNGIIRKAQKVQLARLRIDIGNRADHLLHLNVAKSQVIIPHDLKAAFEDYVVLLKTEAVREFYNRGTKQFRSSRVKIKHETLFETVATNRGAMLKMNDKYPPIATLFGALNENQAATLRLVLRAIETTVNKIRHNHEDLPFNQLDEEELISEDVLHSAIDDLLAAGLRKQMIKSKILPDLGIVVETLPPELLSKLEE